MKALIRIKWVDFGIAFVLAASVLGFVPYRMPLRAQQEVAAKLMCILAVSFFLIKDKWLKLFLAYMAFSAVYFFSKYSLLALMNLTLFVVMMQVIADKLNRERENTLLDAICLIGTAQAGLMYLQANGVWWIFANRMNIPHNIVGFTSNPMLASGLVSMCVPAFLRKRKAWVLLFVLPVLIVNHSLQGILATAVVLVWFIARKFAVKDRLVFLGLMIGAVGLWIWLSGEWQSFVRYDRLRIWTYCMTNIIPQYPILGCGLGNGFLWWKDIMQGCHVTEAFYHPHNEFIYLAMETGLIGLWLCLEYLGHGIERLVKNLDEIKFIVLLGIVSGLLNCMVSFTMHVTIGLVLMAYLSCMQYENGDVKC